MRPIMHKAVLTFLVAFLSVVPAHTQPALEALLTETTGLTMNDVVSLEKEIAPLVESACERKFKKLPEIELITAEDMAARMKRLARNQMQNVCPDCMRDEINAATETQARIYSTQITGQYDWVTGGLYIVPENFTRFGGATSVDRTRCRSLFALTVAHELAHALQDQGVGLNGLSTITDMNEMYAFRAVVEGHASFVEKRVATRLGLDPALIDVSATEAEGDPTYRKGEQFIAYQYERGGNALVWKILARPPHTAAMIGDPGSYGSFSKRPTRLNRLFDELATSRELRGWQLNRIGVLLADVRMCYPSLTEEEESALFSCLEDTRSFRAENKTISATVKIDLFVARSINDALAVSYLLEDTWQKTFDSLLRDDPLLAHDRAFGNISHIKADRARKLSLMYAGGDDSNASGARVFLVVRGNIVLEFGVDRFPLKDHSILEIVNHLFLRYDKLK